MKMNIVTGKHDIAIQKMTSHSHTSHVFQLVGRIMKKGSGMKLIGQTSEEMRHGKLKMS